MADWFQVPAVSTATGKKTCNKYKTERTTETEREKKKESSTHSRDAIQHTIENRLIISSHVNQT